ncbi:MAG: hypothetical protein V7722_09310, partial [Porticoccus sp.]
VAVHRRRGLTARRKYQADRRCYRHCFTRSFQEFPSLFVNGFVLLFIVVDIAPRHFPFPFFETDQYDNSTDWS